ncbi:MAG: type II secretion system ATPase GspE [Thermodesulfobacteriota bacterium]
MQTSLKESLINHGLISHKDWDQASLISQNGNDSIIRVLIQKGKLSEDNLLYIWSTDYGLKRKEKIAQFEIQNDLVRSVPIKFLKKNLLLPLNIKNNILNLALFDPLQLQAMDQLGTILKIKTIRPVLVSSEEIISGINQAYGEAKDQTTNILQGIEDGKNDYAFITDLKEETGGDLLEETSDAPIIKLVNHILSDSVRHKASDIHIEPYRDSLKIRFRLDGVLYNIHSLPKKLHAAIVSRIKILAGLNIAEKRIPQDGRIRICVGNRNVDLRVSSLPTAFGERLVMRLLEKDQRVLDMREIGLDSAALNALRALIGVSHGIILVTGPTGSGKTTTLYAALNEINTPDKNILTIEDPIEYQLDGIGQMQVNPKINLTFANGLRSMVRQDPDVILIGEIRDLETAEIAIQAALTGHLVFSTLHTNDAPGAITRLIDMGIEPFLVSSSVQAILAQRLVRTLCPHCKKKFDAQFVHLNKLGLDNIQEKLHEPFQAIGCSQCMNTGYKGRTGIFELLPVTEKIQSLILKTSEVNQLRKTAKNEGMLTLRWHGIEKIRQGTTTIDEVLRVTQI